MNYINHQILTSKGWCPYCNKTLETTRKFYYRRHNSPAILGTFETCTDCGDKINKMYEEYIDDLTSIVR